MRRTFTGAPRATRVLAALASLGVTVALAGCTPTPTPGPAVSVRPNTGLTDGQVVTLTGSGYAPNSSVGVLQCRAPATSIDQCDGRSADSFSANASGGYTRSMTVRAVVVDAHGVTTDCAAAPGACIVASVYIHGFQGLATATLTFG